MFKFCINKEKGFTLIELLVAMAIFSVVMVMVSDIFLSGLGGVSRVLGSETIQESGRFMLESVSKEIRMSVLNSLDGAAVASLPNGVSGPYVSLNITNMNSQTVSFTFDNTAKQISRGGEILNPDDVETVGRFYLVKNDALQPRVTISFALTNKSQRARERATINLQTTVSSREYEGGAGTVITPPPSETSPTNLVLSHIARSKSFSVSWTAGLGNGGAGGCKLQFNVSGSIWADITSAASVNCDANSNNAAYSLNASGWKASWNGTQVRLVRNSDSEIMGTFPQILSCSATAGSATPTPTIDEDCDGNWDDLEYESCSQWGQWGVWNFYSDPICSNFLGYPEEQVWCTPYCDGGCVPQFVVYKTFTYRGNWCMTPVNYYH